MRTVAFEQGSEAWIEWRRQGVGSADAAAIVGLSRYKTAGQVWAVKVGLAPYPAGDERSRGRLLEPAIRARYEAALGRAAPPRCVEHEEHPFVRASLDGWVESPDDDDGAGGFPLEIKAPGRADHQRAMDGTIPLPHVPQCLHLLLATSAPRLHYASYNERFAPPFELVVLELVRDEPLVGELCEIERAFIEAVRRNEPFRARRLARLDRARLRPLVRRVWPIPRRSNQADANPS